MKPAVSVVVITHNHERFVAGCLKSVGAQDHPITETIVVDNKSADRTARIVAGDFPHVTLIRQRQRRGYSANANTGIIGSSGQFVLLLNPDTRLLAGALSILVSFMESHPRAGILGPRLLNPDGTLQYSYRRFPTVQTALVRRTPFRRFLKNSKANRDHLNVSADHSKRRRVDWLLGGCLMLRRSMLDAIGGFDERFPLYVEDIDLCLRAHQNGWGVWYEPAAQVIHYHLAKSDAAILNRYSLLHARSMIHYVTKHWLHLS